MTMHHSFRALVCFTEKERGRNLSRVCEMDCHSDPSVSLVLYCGGGFAISSYEQKATGAAHAFQVVRDLPYSAVDAFVYREPVAVSAQSFLSQLF